jgi:hypothetical protein
VGSEKQSACDELFECLLTGRSLRHGDTKQGVNAAREEHDALRAENARMREALRGITESIDAMRDEEHACDADQARFDLALFHAREALGGRDD